MQCKEHHPNREAQGWQHHVVGVLCCRRDCRSALHKIDGIMRRENYVDILKQHLKTSVRKLKLGHIWVFQMDNDPKHTSIVVAKWLKDNKVKVLEWPSQSPDLNPIKQCASKEAYKPDSVTPALTGGMGQNSPNLLWEA